MRRNAPMIGTTSTKSGSTPAIFTRPSFSAAVWP